MTQVAPVTPAGTEPAARFAALLVQAGMEARTAGDAQSVLWGKLIVNAAINPVSALWDVPNGTVMTRPELRQVAAAAAREAESVARAKGIALLFPDAAAEVADVSMRTRDNISSMLQDIRGGKRTEIDAINGAVLREGAALGMALPVNEMLVRRVRELEAQQSP